MRAAKDWQDYRLLDTSSGEKLEKWGAVTLVRPDPQVIWRTEKGAAWANPDARYHRSAAGGGSWEYLKKFPPSWEIGWR